MIEQLRHAKSRDKFPHHFEVDSMSIWGRTRKDKPLGFCFRNAVSFSAHIHLGHESRITSRSSIAFLIGKLFSVEMVETLSAKQRSKTAPTPLVDVPLNASAAAVPKSRAVAGSGRRVVKLVLPEADMRHSDSMTIEDNAAIQARRSPLMTPKRTDGEDPFSLTGFFPSHPGSPLSAHPVDWVTGESEHDPRLQSTSTDPRMKADAFQVRGADDGSKGERAWHNTAGSSRSGVVPSRSLSMGALDEYAKEVIDKESSVGIMGLGKLY